MNFITFRKSNYNYKNQVYEKIYKMLYDKDGVCIGWADNASLTIQSDYVPNDIQKILNGSLILPPQYNLTDVQKDAMYDGYDESVEMENQVDLDALDGVDRTDIDHIANAVKDINDKYRADINDVYAKHKSEEQKAPNVQEPDKATT